MIRTNPAHGLASGEGLSQRLWVGTASTPVELESAISLRSRVFREEYGIERIGALWDVDEFDARCDHLVAIDRSRGEVVATTRLLCSEGEGPFYSASEFDLGSFPAQPGRKVEVGRTCVAPEWRNGFTLTLLWKALARYWLKREAEYLFGCCSFKTECPAEAARLVDHFESSEHWDAGYGMRPLAAYEVDGLGDALARLRESDRAREARMAEPASIPPLARLYLRAGARIASYPAHDREFRCLDFVTILSRRDLAPGFQRKFLGK